MGKNITCILVGTWQTMKKGVGEVCSLSDREPFSTRVFWEKTKPHLTVTLYVVKPKLIEQGKCVDFINHAANPRSDQRRRKEKASYNHTL